MTDPSNGHHILITQVRMLRFESLIWHNLAPNDGLVAKAGRLDGEVSFASNSHDLTPHDRPIEKMEERFVIHGRSLKAMKVHP